jgi:hypothetical protein
MTHPRPISEVRQRCGSAVKSAAVGCGSDAVRQSAALPNAALKQALNWENGKSSAAVGAALCITWTAALTYITPGQRVRQCGTFPLSKREGAERLRTFRPPLSLETIQ